MSAPRRLLSLAVPLGAWMALAWSAPAAAQVTDEQAVVDDAVVAEAAAAPEQVPADDPARAPQPRNAFPANLDAVFDFRFVLADGERSWTDGGFGKSRFGGDGEGTENRAVPATAELVWHGPIAWNVGGTVAVAYQDEQDQPVDLIEAFLSWRPLPRGEARFSIRAGMFWPPVSLEHEGAAWAVADMITPSAINSWIGEEVKVVGVEASVVRDLGGSELSASAAIFGFNDTAGTLLAFRGWALHDQTTGAFSRQMLPPLNPFVSTIQPQWTTPTLELDDRPGFYARVAWRTATLSLDAFYYANRGVPEAVTPNLQWGWDTSFFNVGARLDLGPDTRLLAQALQGDTEMGFEENGAYWIDTRFRAAYLRLIHEQGPLALSGRFDLFDTRQRGSQHGSEDDEEGWALTGAAAWRLSSVALLIFEWLHVDSERLARLRVGERPRQSQNIVQAAVRFSL